jgi:antitoxin MazE
MNIHLSGKVMQTNIQKWGNSLGLRIPNLFIKELKLVDGSQVEIIKQDEELIIRSAKSKKSLEEMLKLVTKENCHETIDFGKPEGKEVW